MAQHKKILVSLPDSLLQEVDAILGSCEMNRSEFIREAMKLYIKERRKAEIREMMKKGYLEMASINIEIANECCYADEEQQISYESKLSECE